MHQYMISILRVVFVLVILSCCSHHLLFGAESPLDSETGRILTVTSTGSAPLLEDANLSREIALQAALKDAVVQAAKLLYASNSTIPNTSEFAQFLAEMYPQFISNYTIQADSALTSQYFVSVTAEVQLGKLSLELYQRQIPFPKPRLMVIIPENIRGIPSPTPGAEASIIDGLVTAGFDVVDQTQSEVIRENESVRNAVYGSYTSLLEDQHITGQHVEILIVGEAFSEASGFDSGLYASQAKINIRAIQFDTAKIIATSKCETGATNTSELLACGGALDAAGEMLLLDLIPKLIVKFDPFAGKTVTVMLRDISFEDLIKFEFDLSRNLPGISSIHRRSYASDNAELEIIYDGTGQTLANAFVLTPFTGFDFEIVEFSENRIDLLVNGYDPSFIPPMPDSIKQPATPLMTVPAVVPVVPDTPAKPRTASSVSQLARISVFNFDDPFHTGLGMMAADRVGNLLQRLSFVRYVVSNELGLVNQTIADRVNWFNMSPNSYGSPEEVGTDWIVVGSFTNLAFDFKYTAPIKLSEKLTLAESWKKICRLDISIKVIDLQSYEIVKEWTYWQAVEHSNRYKQNLKSDNTMTKECLQSIMSRNYTHFLRFLYSEFDIPTYVVRRVSGVKGRAIISIGANQGAYREMSLKLLWWDGNRWKELTKATVKAVYSNTSEIEIGDKWLNKIEFGENYNYIYPFNK